MKIKMTWRIWILIIFLALSLISVFVTPYLLQSGVVVKSVEENSTAYNQGLRNDLLIKSVDGKKTESVKDFTEIMKNKFPSEENKKVIIETDNEEIIFYSNKTPEIVVSEIPSTNLKAGLDLAGGSRALVEAKNHSLTSSEAKDLASILSQRLNVYGIKDVDVSTSTDLQGNNRINIEIAGATPDDLESLVSQQGKFEAKIGNETVFTGEEKDITSVARSGTKAGVRNCEENNGQHICQFRFAVYLSQEAAERHANITADIPINRSNCDKSGCYLEKKLDLYLDNKKVDSLNIGESLKGRATTQISISGSGTGKTRDKAYESAKKDMNELQTILITGSLPYELEIVKMDTISPNLGNQFIKSIIFAGLAALIMVTIVVFIRYKRFKPSIALLFTSISEILIILGVASLIDWNLDLPSIAGILITMGTGIDQQIIILDEARQKLTKGMKQKMKRAFAIITGAYFTGLVAMLPLMWAGAGLLEGFAVTTIIGITVGVLITRPAYSDIVKKLEE